MCATALSAPCLYQLVEEYFPAFKAHLAAQGSSLPKHVGVGAAFGQAAALAAWPRVLLCWSMMYSPDSRYVSGC